MLKRLPAIAAVFFLLTAFLTPAFAGTYDSTNAIADALQNNSGYYQNSSMNVPGQDQSLHYITSTGISKIEKSGIGYGFLTYGKPHGEPPRNGQLRYIGYTRFSEDYTNMDYPADKNANGADFASQHWIPQPWDDSAVKASNQNTTKFNPAGLPGDGSLEYRAVIQAGILIYGGTNANNGFTLNNFKQGKEIYDNIEQYVHILAPPTKYAWGIGRMWHIENGQLWYVTIPIMPEALLPENNLKAVSLDLGIPEGQKALHGEYTATVIFENESESSFSDVPVAILHGQYQATLIDENGQALPKKTVGGKEVQVADFDKKGTPGAKRTFTCKWHPFSSNNVDGLEGIINHDDIGRAYQEKDYADNIVRAEVPVELINLMVDDFDSGAGDEGVAGQRYTATVTFTNQSNVDLKGIPVAAFNNGYRARLKDSSGTEITEIDLAAGESKICTFEYTAQEESSTLKAVIDAPPLEEKYEETTEEDNIVEIEVVTGWGVSSGGNGQLTFQAVSQGGKDLYGKYISPTSRPVNTAKWEDMVTATLKPPAPTPPKGTLKSWSITSAKITIPKQHPKWTFNTPYEPVASETLNMNANGHTADETFKETWSINGFNSGSSAPGVYSHIEKRVMAANPKSYTITAEYTIHYTYEWKERHRSCSGSGKNRHCHTYYVTKTGSGSTSGTASGKLLVNGAGRVPY